MKTVILVAAWLIANAVNKDATDKAIANTGWSGVIVLGVCFATDFINFF